MIKRHPEPFLWLLFSSGGAIAAMLIPVLLVLFGVAFPLGWLPPPDHVRLVALISNPLTRLVIFGLCMLSFFHAAHRLRYTLYDGLQIQHLNEFIALVCYGGAIAGTLVAAYLLVTVG
jgi:fumarate reductase subunit D